MGIGNVRAAEGVAGEQMVMARSVDSVSKGIQNEISNVQRQMQELSSKADMSVEEKMKKRQELQQEISNLNTQLRQRQAELRQEQQKKASADETRTETAAADTEKIGVGMSGTGMQAMVEAGSALKHARHQGAVVTRIEGGIGILKSEIRQDESRGADVEKKREELAGLEERAQNAAASRSEVIGKAHRSMRAAAEREREGTEDKPKVKADKAAQDRVLIKATNFSKEKNQAAQQQIYTSVDIRG